MFKIGDRVVVVNPECAEDGLALHSIHTVMATIETYSPRQVIRVEDHQDAWFASCFMPCSESTDALKEKSIRVLITVRQETPKPPLNWWKKPIPTPEPGNKNPLLDVCSLKGVWS